MSDFVYPRHGCIQELMLKEKAWTAKFIRRQREEKAEEAAKSAVKANWEKQAEDMIMNFVNSPSKTSLQSYKTLPARSSSPASIRSRSSQPLSLAGAMAMEG
eukprot:TRINITY_DN17935_c0_g2_i1.p1 TRINITY_DN17935_c0_g2~~TRINITY_DN17935_c0_g2_i1.p1  ORF type:complete len:102 (+),score=26.48 TRINITY_DN17935_c0_g2_i1:89-394(+)